MALTLDHLGKQAASLQQTADELSSRFEKLTTFEEAARWDADAFAVVRLFEQYRDAVAGFRSSEQQALQEANAARGTLPFFKRLFASRRTEKSREANIKQADKGTASVETAISQLFELADRTPACKAEQKEMLSELRLLKKELTTEKRSVNEAMRIIRTQARQNMATWTGVQRGFTGSVARLERMQIRHQKEGALSPHEDAKAAIERQLIEMERRINWVSRFKGEDPREEQGVVRCAYCGRRVTAGSPCPGCGSDSTIRDI
jgi:hypothetical protein